MIDKIDITGIILAGGKSSRMGSDKALLKLNDATFIEHIVKAMEPLVKDIIIVSNNKNHDKFGFKRVSDMIEDAGPLSGLYSGLKHSETENNLILSCDVPLINGTVLQRLIECIDDDFDLVQLESQGKTMPLIALYKKQCWDKCLELLEKGERRLKVLTKKLKTKTIKIDPKLDQYVKNINTVDQLNDIRHAIKH